MYRKLIFSFIISGLIFCCNKFTNNSTNASITGYWCFMDNDTTYWEIKVSDSSIFINNGISKNLITREKNNPKFPIFNLSSKEYFIKDLICDTLIICNDENEYSLSKFIDKADERIYDLAFQYRKYNYLVHQGIITVDSAFNSLRILSMEFYGIEFSE